MRLSLPLRIVLGACALGSALEAQVDFFADGSAESLHWPFDHPELVGGRALAGDVTGDGLPDAVFQRAGKLVVVYGPAAYLSAFELDFVATDACLLPASEAGAAAALIVVNAAGVWRLSGYDGGAFQSVLEPAPSWAGAQRVIAGDVDGDGFADLAGLSAAGDLLLLTNLRGSPVESVLPMSAPVLDLLALDWSGSAAAELVALRADGVFVLAAGGSELFALHTSVGAGFLLPLARAGSAHGRCALVRSAPGAPQLFVLAASLLEPPLALPSAAGYFGGAAADVDGDGNDDVYLVGTGSHQGLLLLDQGAAPSFALGAASSELVDVQPGVAPSPTWSCWPLLADFSLDGDPDLLQFVEATGECRYLEDLRAPLERGQVEVSGGAYLFHQGSHVGELRLYLRAPPNLAFAATHVRVIGWRQTDALSGSTAVEPSAVVNDVFELDASGKVTTQILLDEPEVFTPNVYSFEMRAVRLEGPERVQVASGPPVVHAFSTPEVLTAELEAEFGAGLALRTILVGTVSGGKQTVKKVLGPIELAERALAPKEVKTVRVPVIALPPDPF